MKTVRRMIYGEVIAAVGFATLAFLALFSFIDFVDELRWVNSNGPDGYQLKHAIAFVGTLAVSSLYELLPITVLIGSVFVMARMAQQLGVHGVAHQWARPLARAAHDAGPGPPVRAGDFCRGRLPGAAGRPRWAVPACQVPA